MEEKMKYLIILLTTMFLVSSASADMGFRELAIEEHIDTRFENFFTSTNCIDGYKWIYVVHAVKQGEYPMTVALEQFYEEKNGRAVPAKC